MRTTRTCPTCGFTGTYATERVADHHHGNHSCTRHLRLAELARRRAERIAGGPRRDCRHTRTHHAHGTRTAYVKDRCRCPGCTDANATASRIAYREKAYGRWNPYVDAAPVREHILALRAAGIGLRRIAQLADVSPTTLRAMIHTSAERQGHGGDRIRPETAEAILAIKPAAVSRADYSSVDPVGTRRRLQALVAIGWSIPQLAAHLNRTPAHLARTMGGVRVTFRTAKQVQALYEQLWDAPPPRDTSAARSNVEAARAAAQKNGWPPPLAWDDIDADPYPKQPDRLADNIVHDVDEIAIARAVAGDYIRLKQLTPAEQDEVVRRLTEQGKSIRAIAGQLHTTKRTISRRRRRSCASMA